MRNGQIILIKFSSFNSLKLNDVIIILGKEHPKSSVFICFNFSSGIFHRIYKNHFVQLIEGGRAAIEYEEIN